MNRLLRSLFAPRVTAGLAATCGFALLSACAPTDGTDLDPDDGPGIDDGADAGPGDDDPNDPNETTGGESCADAPTVSAGSISGTTAGAGDDHQGSCDTFSEGPGGDVVYGFSLGEESGVTLDLTGEGTYDPILYVFSASTCGADDEIGCTDAVGTTESLSFPSLAAGEYYVVVDTFIGALDETTQQTDGAAFTLDIALVEPFCQPDQFDPADGEGNNTPSTSIGTGLANIDTSDLDPETPEADGIDLSLCPDDVDYFNVEHIGGALTVTASGGDGDPAPTVEIFSATAVLEDGTITDYTEGAAFTSGEDAARGFYLVKLSAESIPNTGLDYSFAVTHGCEGDEFDRALPELDDEDVANAPTFFSAPAEPRAQKLCGEDRDAWVLNNIVEGDVTVTLAGAGGLTATASSIAEDDEGERTATALDAGAYTVATEGDDLVVTIPGAATGLYLVTASGATDEVEYTFTATFAGLDGPPANDTCGTGETLTIGESVFGRTIGGTHTLTGPTVDAGEDEDGNPVTASCNGDGEVPDDSETGNAAEVFYYLTVDDAVDTEITVDGSSTSFSAALYVLAFPDQTCPSDLSTLAPVEVGEAPLCETGSEIRARIPALAAGDYLVVVDGIYSPPFEFFGIEFPESTSEGAFDLAVTTFADGFPPPAACQAATSLDIPTAGAPTTTTVDYTEASSELVGACGGNGAEVIYVLRPDADVTLDIVAGGTEDDIDTVVYLLTGTCDETAAAANTAEQCNDDGPNAENFGSELTVSLTGGETYYLVADAFSATEGTAGLTLSVAE